MVIRDPIVRHLALIPWARPGQPGIPEHFVPAPQSSVLSELSAPLQRAWVALRALPSGEAQLLADTPTGATALHLASPPQPVAIQSSGQVLDAILDPTGALVVLEAQSQTIHVRALHPDGTLAWQIPNLLPPDPDGPSRLLTDAASHIFVATPSLLLRLDQGQATEISRWPPAGDPFMRPDGTLAYVVYNPARNARDWVLYNPLKSTQTVIPGTESGWGILAHAIGVDALGRAYGHAAGVLGRIALNGRMDWQVTLQGIAIDPQRNIALLLHDRGALRILHRQGSLSLEPSRLPAHVRLIGQSPDGTFLLYARTAPTGHGTLFLIDPQGRPAGQQAAPEDIWQTADDLRPPSASSITPTGDILLSVLTPAGIHILQLTPP